MTSFLTQSLPTLKRKSYRPFYHNVTQVVIEKGMSDLKAQTKAASSADMVDAQRFEEMKALNEK